MAVTHAINQILQEINNVLGNIIYAVGKAADTIFAELKEVFKLILSPEQIPLILLITASGIWIVIYAIRIKKTEEEIHEYLKLMVAPMLIVYCYFWASRKTQSVIKRELDEVDVVCDNPLLEINDGVSFRIDASDKMSITLSFIYYYLVFYINILIGISVIYLIVYWYYILAIRRVTRSSTVSFVKSPPSESWLKDFVHMTNPTVICNTFNIFNVALFKYQFYIFIIGLLFATLYSILIIPTDICLQDENKTRKRAEFKSKFSFGFLIVSMLTVALLIVSLINSKLAAD